MNVLIDPEDSHFLVDYNLYVHRTKSGNCYIRGYKKGSSSRYQTYLHHLIVGRTEGCEIDHINGNGLDNRKQNLRTVVPSGNRRNRKRRKGYHFEKWTGKWRALIRFNGKRISLGRFDSENDASKAYERAYHSIISKETMVP